MKTTILITIFIGIITGLWLSTAHGHDVSLYPVHGWDVNINGEPKCPSGGAYTNMGHHGTIRVSHVQEIIPWDGEIFTGGTYRHGEKIKRIRYSMRDGEFILDMINGDYMRHPKFNPATPHGHRFENSRGDDWYGYYQEPLSMLCVDEVAPMTTQDTGQEPPDTGQEPPDTGQNTPDTGQNPPSTEQDPPSTEQDPPSTEQDPPNTRQDPPNTGQNTPDTEQDPPNTEREPPSTEREPPSTEQNPPTSSETPTPDTSDDMTEPKPDTPTTDDSSEQMTITEPEYVSYSITFPQGISALHLPIKPNNIYFTNLYEKLGDDNVNWISALRPTVQVWSIIRSSESRTDGWISSYRGFVVYMEQEVTIELKAIKRGFSYSTIYIKDGMNLIGVPLQSEALEMVGDFYTIFPCVTSVKGIPMYVMFDMPNAVDLDWFEELDDDTMIDGETAYMLQSDGNDEYTLWGTQWQMATPSAAPGVVRQPRSLITTWGALKARIR